MKPFTTIAGILFLLGAAIHGYRLFAGFAINISGHAVPLAASWGGVATGLIFGVMLLVEARR